jgi:hypothetical protein
VTCQLTEHYCAGTLFNASRFTQHSTVFACRQAVRLSPLFGLAVSVGPRGRFLRVILKQGGGSGFFRLRYILPNKYVVCCTSKLRWETSRNLILELSYPLTCPTSGFTQPFQTFVGILLQIGTHLSQFIIFVVIIQFDIVLSNYSY